MKKFFAIILALCMLLSLGLVAHADEHDHDHEVANGVGEQIKFLAGRFADLEQKDDGNTWHYAVTDLDHNGRLELLATCRDKLGLNWLRAWEISPNGATLISCTQNTIPAPIGSDKKTITADGMLLNLYSNSVDTCYDKDSNTYCYLFKDVAEYTATEATKIMTPGGDAIAIAVSSDVVTTGVGAAALKNGSMEPSIMLGSCTTWSEGDGDLKVYCRNGKGEEITMDEFLTLGASSFKGLPHFSTAFDWFTADEAGMLQRFVDSYATFDGVRDADNAEGGVAFTASQSAGGVYITKNPTDEKHNEGQTAEFIANANIYDKITWTFVAPDGKTYTVDDIRKIGGQLEGENTGDLKIKNVKTNMNGWGVFATFDYRGASARTSTAYLYVWAGGSTSDLSAKIDEFYRVKPWLNGVWTCPKCSAAVSGSQCWNCGFNPVSFYAIYYGVTPTGYDWYYGLNGQTPVNTITPNPYVGVLAWICPICGESTQNYVTCWNCGYHYGDPVYLPAHPTSGTFAWTCPVCGEGNQDVMDCWSCGYHYGNPVGYNDPAWNTYREALMGADLIACWFCGQYFNSDYDCCPYCGSYPGGGNFYGEIMSDQYNELMQGATLITCWSCGQAYNSDYDTCPYCGNYPQSGPTWVDEVDSNQLREAIQGATMITCWNCGRDYNYDYDSCPYCGSYPHTASGLPAEVVTANQISEAYQGADMIQCANCGQLFNHDYDTCPYCGWAP